MSAADPGKAVALLARAGDARDRLRQALDQAGARVVLEEDPGMLAAATLAAAQLQAVLVALEPTVEDALMVLGLPAVRAMALGFSLLSNYRKGSCEVFDYTRFWTSSVLMALSMQALARRLRVIPADDAFSVGLLARIGELALATIYPADFGLVLRKVAASPDARQLDLEQAAFALTHCELGAAQCEFAHPFCALPFCECAEDGREKQLNHWAP